MGRKPISPPVSPKEREATRIGHKALLDAIALAKARGLSEEDVEREVADRDSQLWRDVAAIGRRLRQQKKAL